MTDLGANRNLADMQHQQMRGNWKTAKLINAYDANAGEDVVTAGEDISLYTYTSIHVNTTDNCTVRYQLSPDNTNWFDPIKFQDATPTKLTAVVNNDSVVIEVDPRCPSLYIRLFVTATAASTINAWVVAQM